MIRSFLKLDFQDKVLLIKALFLLYLVRIMLWTLPFTRIQRIVEGINLSHNKHGISIEKLTWAIETMSTYTPRATCLTRALAAQILLARYHYSSNIKIGVSNNKGEFEAHAWLEANDQIILGESETEYTPILKMGEKTR